LANPDNVVLEFLNREIANAGEQADLVVDQKNRGILSGATRIGHVKAPWRGGDQISDYECVRAYPAWLFEEAP
jgi:hypothetical protein